MKRQNEGSDFDGPKIISLQHLCVARILADCSAIEMEQILGHAFAHTTTFETMEKIRILYKMKVEVSDACSKREFEEFKVLCDECNPYPDLFDIVNVLRFWDSGDAFHLELFINEKGTTEKEAIRIRSYMDGSSKLIFDHKLYDKMPLWMRPEIADYFTLAKTVHERLKNCDPTLFELLKKRKL